MNWKPISPKISERFSVKITFKERSNVRILLTKSCKEAFPITVEIRIMECNLNSRVKFLWNKINYLKVTMKLSGLEIKLRLNFYNSNWNGVAVLAVQHRMDILDIIIFWLNKSLSSQTRGILQHILDVLSEILLF